MTEDQEYEIEKIQKKFTKNNQTFYLVKWFDIQKRQWISSQDLSGGAKEIVDKFQRKLRFKKELKSYVSDKGKSKEKEDKVVIVLDSEQQVKPVICISSEQEDANEKQAAPEQGTSSQPIVIVLGTPQNNPQAQLAPIQDQLPTVSLQDMVEVNRYNYTLGVWEIRKTPKIRLLKAAMIRETYEAYQANLPPMRIIRAITIQDKKMIRFQCKGKMYQTHYAHIRKYRPAQLLQFYQHRKDLFTKRKAQYRV